MFSGRYIYTSVSQPAKSSDGTFYYATISDLVRPRYLLTVVLKWDLFARFANDRAAYIQGKADFVTQLVQRAIAQS